jgi:hypothetical protein
LALAEAQHVKAATLRDDFSQACNVLLPLVVIENVEETAVEHRDELRAQISQAKSIRHQESRLDAPLGCLRRGQLDGLR